MEDFRLLADRFKTALELIITLKSLCLVLGFDFKFTLLAAVAHPAFNENTMSKNISKKAIKRLTTLMCRLQEIKIQRMHKLQQLARNLLALWNSMDTPTEEKQSFHIVTRHVASSEHELTEPYILSSDFLNKVELEISRLEGLKPMKELVSRKKIELEKLRRRTHLLVDTNDEIEVSGTTDLQKILEKIEAQILKVKEDSFLREAIVDRAEKWLSLCEEEPWLEKCIRGEVIYISTRDPNRAFERVERARALVNKIPAMSLALARKTIAWENERGIEFQYDGLRLLSMIENYCFLWEEKEQERKRKMKTQGEAKAEGVAFFGYEQSPTRLQRAKNMAGNSMHGPNITID